MRFARLLILSLVLMACPASAQRWREDYSRTFSERLLGVV